MAQYEIEMAEHFEAVIEENRKKLVQEMRHYDLDVLPLELHPWDLTRTTGSDGLHLGPERKRELFDQIISKTIETQLNGPPRIKEVGPSGETTGGEKIWREKDLAWKGSSGEQT